MNKVQLSVAGVALASAAFAAGYFVADKRLETKYRQLLDEEIREFKDIYPKLTNLKPIVEVEEGEEPVTELSEETYEESTAYYKQPLSDEAKKDVTDKTKEIAKDEEPEELPQPDPKVYDIHPYRGYAPLRDDTNPNIFIQPHDGGVFNYLEEQKTRTEYDPYVISEDEYINREKGYETACLNYYALDDTMADENERMVDNVDFLIGEKNLKRFGHGSTNEDIVFIRNDGIGMEFEVERVNRSYREFVLGFEGDE